MPWFDLECDHEAGEVLVGVVSFDYGWDSLDTVAAVCEAEDGSQRQVGNLADQLNVAGSGEQVTCPAGQTVVELVYRDAYFPGIPLGTTDAVGIVCSGDATPILPPDLASNPLADRIVGCDAGQIAVGVSYGDGVRHPVSNAHYSDLTDAVTLLCADDCGECEPTVELQPYPDDFVLGSAEHIEVELLCDDDETMTGLMYRDYWWDGMDSAAVQCSNAEGEVRLVANQADLVNSLGPEEWVSCPAPETVIGIAYKDIPYWAGVPVDKTDGVTVVCSGGSIGKVEDLASNDEHPFRTVACPAGTEPAGIQYADTWVGYSDLTDGVTVACRVPCD